MGHQLGPTESLLSLLLLVLPESALNRGGCALYKVLLGSGTLNRKRYGYYKVLLGRGAFSKVVW